ncbi:MAG: FumA C-terminus/TtdB family hydratase beta subunit [Candidatus Omnitrophica bacterium]|nr:FumA C-terminus/TtdB family hydratase beta subunit [Candidatus Omnitrophota bacterium]MBU1925717.1 FumA C-terminus/TtdB family hydratase beta subunit [Candidatus Omnitrophota bacterium]MBU2064198.1 FumA C-terminus/TtdB family hydratase beta subunit [Candidatus Omnitrophota bacterium]
MYKLKAPLTKDKIGKLRTGEALVYDGILYTARDQAHRRFAELIKKNKKLPIDLKGQIIYYCGPNPAAPGKIIGACGPTTSQRMDRFAPALMKAGVLGMVGKGERSPDVVRAIKKYRAVYFATYAGCGALLSRYVKNKKIVCFEDLGTEAVFALNVSNFPLLVAVDCMGGSIYDERR